MNRPAALPVPPPPVVAIDGPAASGKSSTALAVAGALGAVHLDSGALYRAVTLVALETGAGDPEALLRRAEQRGLRLERFADGIHPVLDGSRAEARLRSPEVNARVSEVSAVPQVREWVNRRLRGAVDAARTADREVVLVLDGRDIGTMVFPEAPLKVFLTATPEARATRRLIQRGILPQTDLIAEEAARLAERDRLDQARTVAPLRQAEDAVLIDTTELGFVEQVRRIEKLARARLSLPSKPATL